MSAAVAGTTFRPTPTYTTLRDVTLAIARKLLKRSYHTLSELGEEALQPA